MINNFLKKLLMLLVQKYPDCIYSDYITLWMVVLTNIKQNVILILTKLKNVTF